MASLDQEILRCCSDGCCVKCYSDQRMVRQELGVDDDRRSRMIHTSDEYVELKTAGMCRLTDHIVHIELVKYVADRKVCELLMNQSINQTIL